MKEQEHDYGICHQSHATKLVLCHANRVLKNNLVRSLLEYIYTLDTHIRMYISLLRSELSYFIKIDTYILKYIIAGE